MGIRGVDVAQAVSVEQWKSMIDDPSITARYAMVRCQRSIGEVDADTPLTGGAQ